MKIFPYNLICMVYKFRHAVLTSLTLTFAFADVSRKAQLKVLAKFWPWSLPTTRSSSKSHLLPTKIIGTCRRNRLQLKYIKTNQKPKQPLFEV